MSNIGKAADNDFADLALHDPSDNEIARQATNSLPIILPWSKKSVRLGTCYQSSSQSSGNPWLESSPFILSDLYTMPTILDRSRGTEASYKSVITSRECETGDHLSLGFGVGVGLPFLASVSVKGTYDKEVQENRDSNKMSIRSSVRCASVNFSRSPRLTNTATVTLKYGDGGYANFCHHYGDYYVAGYRIGGDTGLLLSSNSFRHRTAEKYGITATLEVLFWKLSKTWTKDIVALSEGKVLKLLGYDTLEGRNWTCPTGDCEGIVEIGKQAKMVMDKAHCILERIDAVLDRMGMDDGRDLSREDWDALMMAGVVVELVLLPMASVRDVARWKIEGDVI